MIGNVEEGSSKVMGDDVAEGSSKGMRVVAEGSSKDNGNFGRRLEKRRWWMWQQLEEKSIVDIAKWSIKVMGDVAEVQAKLGRWGKRLKKNNNGGCGRRLN